MAETIKGRKKGHARGKRRSMKIAAYYELTYPLRKLRRIWRDTGRTSALKAWADNYRTPTGSTANGVLVRLGRELHIAGL